MDSYVFIHSNSKYRIYFYFLFIYFFGSRPNVVSIFVHVFVFCLILSHSINIDFLVLVNGVIYAIRMYRVKITLNDVTSYSRHPVISIHRRILRNVNVSSTPISYFFAFAVVIILVLISKTCAITQFHNFKW